MIMIPIPCQNGIPESFQTPELEACFTVNYHVKRLKPQYDIKLDLYMIKHLLYTGNVFSTYSAIFAFFTHILTLLRSVQIWGVNGAICRGVGGLELSKTTQNKVELATFSPESSLQQ